MCLCPLTRDWYFDVTPPLSLQARWMWDIFVFVHKNVPIERSKKAENIMLISQFLEIWILPFMINMLANDSELYRLSWRTTFKNLNL